MLRLIIDLSPISFPFCRLIFGSGGKFLTGYRLGRLLHYFGQLALKLKLLFPLDRVVGRISGNVLGDGLCEKLVRTFTVLLDCLLIALKWSTHLATTSTCTRFHNTYLLSNYSNNLFTQIFN